MKEENLIAIISPKCSQKEKSLYIDTLRTNGFYVETSIKLKDFIGIFRNKKIKVINTLPDLRNYFSINTLADLSLLISIINDIDKSIPEKNLLSGSLNNYYLAHVNDPQRKEQEPYTAECEDIIQALGMDFNEGCEFKAIWRTAAARLGNGKQGHSAKYDAEKRVHYAKRSLRYLEGNSNENNK